MKSSQEIPETLFIDDASLSSYIFPEKLQEFDCGVKKINDFLTKEAELYQRDGTASTTLFIDEENNIIGFCTIHVAITNVKVEGINQTEEMNSINLAYFAIDKKYQGLTLGKQLIKGLLFSLLYTSKIVGFRVVTVESLPETFDFYIKCGFEEAVPGTYENHRLKKYDLIIPFNKLFDLV